MMTNVTATTNKTVGILGGMGPYAGLMFMKNVMDITQARKDADHVHMIMDSHPHLPSRTRAILYNEQSPLQGMIEAITRLQNYPVDAVVIPCNSACFWIPEIVKKVKVPVIDIVDVATAAFCAQFTAQKIAVLGGPVTLSKQIYRKTLEKAGREYVQLPENYTDKIYTYIEHIKTTGDGKSIEKDFISFVSGLKKEFGFDGLILACTEFSTFRETKFEFPVLDSSAALANFVVEYAKYGRPIPLKTDEISQFWKKRAAMLQDNKVGLLQSTMLTAAEGEAETKWENEKNALMSQIAPILKPTDKILEFGCGLGRWSRELCKHVGFVEAFDSCDEFIKKAIEINRDEKIENIRFFTSGIGGLDVRQPLYDHTVSIALLHYLSDDEFAKAMEAVRVGVKPGGYAIFRESFGLERRFELHGFYSDVLDTEYHAVYRQSSEISQALGDEFELVLEKMNLAPTDKKPETCQKVLIFKKKN